MKTRLSMEAARDIADVCHLWTRGRISASKARGIMEGIAFDGVDLRDIDPRELGGSEADLLVYTMRRLAMPDYKVDELEKASGLPWDRTAQLLSRLARDRKIERASYGIYRLRKART